jgi:hypothetical protein
MKNFFISLLISVSFVTIGKSQNAISCDKLIEVVSDKCYKLGGLTPLQLIQSDWLYRVDAYECDENIFVIADIRVKNGYFNETKSYIFCGIPKENWDNFTRLLVDINLSHGEKFHKYIIDYKCNCY